MSSESKNTFASELMASLYLNPKWADVLFLFEIDEEVPAQKSILAAASPVFDAMFFGPIKEKDVVKIDDSNPSAFKEFLQLFYLENVKLTMENTDEVARLADKYDMVDCFNKIATSLIGEFTMDNMCWGYQMAIATGHDELIKFCEKNISAFSDDAFKSATFLHCDQKVLKKILQLDNIQCKETEIFEACIEWAKFNCKENGIDESKAENLKAQLGDCFNLIRFGVMTLEEFTIQTKPYYKMFSQIDLANIFYNLSPNIFNKTPRLRNVIQWDKDQVLECVEYDSVGTPTNYYLQNSESLWFSSNALLILGEIFCYSLKNSQGYHVAVNFNISVNEASSQSFTETTSTKTVYNGSIQLKASETRVTLPQPILINPRKMYEIRLATGSEPGYYYYSSTPQKVEVKLDQKILVEFRRRPSNISRRGLVCRLNFNKF